MSERTGVITFKGNGMTLLGDEVKVAADAPNVTLKGAGLKDVELSSFKGKPAIVISVPSLDTPVCDTEARRFAEEVGKLADKAALVIVSMDLPMAQARWCGAAGIENAVCLSDYKDHSFGTAYGVRIKELGLLARAVWVVDKNGDVQYTQIVGEVTKEPNYDAALDALKKLV
jgi:thiol peroxidase